MYNLLYLISFLYSVLYLIIFENRTIFWYSKFRWIFVLNLVSILREIFICREILENYEGIQFLTNKFFQLFSKIPITPPINSVTKWNIYITVDSRLLINQRDIRSHLFVPNKHESRKVSNLGDNFVIYDSVSIFEVKINQRRLEL